MAMLAVEKNGRCHCTRCKTEYRWADGLRECAKCGETFTERIPAYAESERTGLMTGREAVEEAAAIFGIAVRAAQAGQAEYTEQKGIATDGDYLNSDGLLMCGRCETPKQTQIDVPLIGLRIVPVACRCIQEAREREEAQRRAVEEQDRINKLRRMGITSNNYRGMTFANDDGGDPETGNIARRYVENRAEMLKNNIGLLFHGGVGGGKTFFAAAIANAMIDNGYSAMITTVPELITAMAKDFEANKADILAQISKVKILVLDDVGFERVTSYGAEKLFEIINTRVLSGKPLIVTTNLTLQELAHPEDMDYKRPFDRIIEMCQPVHVSGEGRRKAIAREKGKIARDILGL